MIYHLRKLNLVLKGKHLSFIKQLKMIFSHVYTLVDIVLGIWGLWKSPSFVNSVAPEGLEWLQTSLCLDDQISFYSHPTPDLKLAETGLVDKKMGQLLSAESFPWTGFHSLWRIGFILVLSLLTVLYFHQGNDKKRIVRGMDSVTRDLHAFKDKIYVLQHHKHQISELKQENEKLLQQLHQLEKTNEKLLRQLDDLEEIEQENTRLYDQLNNVSPVQAVGNFWDTDIPLCSYEKFHDQITVIKDLGEGAYGYTQLVEYGQESCVLKTTYEIMAKKELQIMAFLDGAGGTPRLLAATNYDFVCTFAGEMQFLDMINDSSMDQHALIESICQIAHQVKAIHEKGISHNDIKSDNIMFDSSTGEFNIIDFGMACHMGGYLPAMGPNILKRIDWMAPECKLGEVITPASDVYSLGVMLGKVSFIFKNPNEIAMALAGKAISQDPEERPTMDEFISVLEMVCKYNNEYYMDQFVNAFSAWGDFI